MPPPRRSAQPSAPLANRSDTSSSRLPRRPAGHIHSSGLDRAAPGRARLR
ncbi:hypothetical protein ACFPRL_14875 [Pseudoclavibacter helvolus]